MSAEGPVRHCHQWLSNLMLSETIRLLSGHTWQCSGKAEN